MKNSLLTINYSDNKLSLKFSGEFNLYIISSYEKELLDVDLTKTTELDIDLNEIEFFDTAASIFINNLTNRVTSQNIRVNIICSNRDVLDTLELVKSQKKHAAKIPFIKKKTFLQSIG
ncbi:MAG: STAS domain-containing protein, partial [Sulfurimonas sp.]|nr:STAS domain-containing protein [Sulfurimonas sp.]